MVLAVLSRNLAPRTTTNMVADEAAIHSLAESDVAELETSGHIEMVESAGKILSTSVIISSTFLQT